MKTAWSLIVNLLVVVFLVSCSVNNASETSWFASNSKRAKEAEVSSQASYYFLLAELSLRDKNYQEALRNYRKSLNLEKGDTNTIRKRIIEISIRNGDLDTAVAELEKIKSTNDPDLLKLKAGMLATQKKFDEAIKVYKQLETLNSGLDDETNIFLASLYAQKGDYASAKKLLDQVLKNQPQSVFAKYYLAKILLGLNDSKNSEKYFKEILQVVPIIEPAYLDLARLYVYQKRIPEAIDVLQLLVKRSPGNKAARSLLGELLLGEERINDAIREFEALGKMQDDPAETRLRIAALKLQQRDFEGAEFELKLVLTHDKDNSIARYYLANAYGGQRKIGEAVNEIKKIKKEQPYFMESRMMAVYFLKQENKFDQAIDFIDEILLANPKDNKLLLLKANLLKEADRRDESIEIIENLSEKKPKDDALIFTLAVLRDENGEKNEAIKLLRKCIEVNPNNANALNYLGYSMAEQNDDLNQAKIYIERALELEPDNGYFLDSLGWVYYKLNQYDSAKLHMQKAISIVADDAVILEHMAKVYIAVKDINSAKQIISKALEYAPDSDDKEVESRLKELLNSLADE